MHRLLTIASLANLLACAPQPSPTDSAAPTTTSTTTPWTLELATWNVESGDSDPQVVKQHFADNSHLQLWGLTEVDYDAAFVFRETISEGPGDYLFIAGTSGDYAEDDDRLVILYDTLRFEALDTCELRIVNQDNSNNQRVPLVAHMRDIHSGTEFLFMVNHFQRDEGVRLDQATRLSEWISGELEQRDCALSAQTLPLLAVGDYNLDVNVRYPTDDNVWLNELLKTLTWIVPEPYVQSHCSWDDMLLDFVFVAGAATEWHGTSQVYEEETSAVCGGRTPESADHRPVLAQFWF